MAEVIAPVERGFEKGVESERARSEDALAAAHAASDAKLAEAKAKLVAAERRAAVVTPEKSKPPAEAPQKVTVTSWNIANFTHNKSNPDDEVYRDQRYNLLAERLDDARPTVLFVQELASGPGGVKAMNILTSRLNDKLGSGDRYKSEVSAKASAGGGRERYGVLLDAKALGETAPEFFTQTPYKTPPFRTMMIFAVFLSS